MMTTTARKPATLSDTQQLTHRTGSIVTKKLWLPKSVYKLLPYFYISSGIAAFFATLYISEWFWVLPHYLLFSAACIHLGLLVQRRRRQQTPESSENDPS